MNKLTLLVTTILLSTSAHATDFSKDIAVCAAKNGDLSRLACYDSIAKKNGLDKPQSVGEVPQGTGKWEVSTKVNPIDDSKTVTLYLTSESGKSAWGNKVSLIARCSSNKTALYINWNDYLGNEARVLTRIGNSKAKTSLWSLSTDSKATFRSKPIGFLKQLMKSDKFVAQITPYNENPVTAVFDTTGLKNAIKPLRETCNW